MAKQEKEKKNQKQFWKDFKAELKKVIWPTKKQLANNTLVVVAMVLATTVVVLVLDLAFEALNTYGINKLKTTVQDAISVPADEEGSDENTSSEEEHNHEEETNTEASTENQEGTNTEASAENNNEEQNETTEQE